MDRVDEIVNAVTYKDDPPPEGDEMTIATDDTPAPIEEIIEEVTTSPIEEEEVIPTLTPPVQEEKVDSDIEKRAREMGWAGPEDFRGDPSRFIDAETFVKRGETVMPILRERLGKVERELDKERKAREDFQEYHKADRERLRQSAYAQAVKDIQNKQRDAVVEHDVEAYDQLEGERTQLDKEYKEEEEKITKEEDNTPSPVTQEDASRNLEEWQSQPENFWFGTNMKATQAARKISDDVLRDNAEGWVGVEKEFFDEVAKQTRAKHSDLFANPRRLDSPTVGNTDNPAPRNVGEKTFNDLPPEAQAECRRLVAQKSMTVKQYVDEYITDTQMATFE